MMLLIFLLFLACSVPPIPDLRVQNGTFILRESFQGPGAERTGNWQGRFDVDGCWWESHNTWMYVTDPGLSDVPAYNAHWNAVEPDEPWFCVQDSHLAELHTLVDGLPKGSQGYGYVRALDRWTVVKNGHAKSHVVYRGLSRGEWKPLLDYFDELAAVSVWGQSPE